MSTSILSLLLGLWALAIASMPIAIRGVPVLLGVTILLAAYFHYVLTKRRGSESSTRWRVKTAMVDGGVVLSAVALLIVLIG